MTAVTETLRLDHIPGNLRAVTAFLDEVANAYTWDTGLGTIVWVGITTATATASEEVGAVWSGSTVTFAVQGSSHPDLYVIAIGY